MTIVFMVLLNPAKLNSFIGPSGRSWGPNWRNSSSWALTIWYLNLCMLLNSRLSKNKNCERIMQLQIFYSISVLHRSVVTSMQIFKYQMNYYWNLYFSSATHQSSACRTSVCVWTPSWCTSKLDENFCNCSICSNVQGK